MVVGSCKVLTPPLIDLAHLVSKFSTDDLEVGSDLGASILDSALGSSIKDSDVGSSIPSIHNQDVRPHKITYKVTSKVRNYL